MSSKPDSENVSNLRRLIRLRRSVVEGIKTARAAASKLERLTEEEREISREILKAVEGMDCKSDGNAGWEGRFVWMLDELLHQRDGE